MIFTSDFLDGRRDEFIASIKGARYDYAFADSSGGNEQAYIQSTSKYGYVMTFTLIMPAVVVGGHTIKKVYLYDKEDPAESDIPVGEVDTAVSVNSSQTVLVNINITLQETESPSEEPDEGEPDEGEPEGDDNEGDEDEKG